MSKCNRFCTLSLFERERIDVYKAQGQSMREIGRLLNRSHTTISREWKRNHQPHPLMRGYIGCYAHVQPSTLRVSEIMTISIHFHQSHYRNFKAYYLHYVMPHLRGISSVGQLQPFCRTH